MQKGRDPYTAAHELGHILTDKPASTNLGHYSSPGGRRIDLMNLMSSTIGASKNEGFLATKRLWDTNDADSVDQIFEITLRWSRFIRA